jgi:hypothetical protein
MGETTPEIEVSESIRPWGKFLPAPYLPVGRFDVHKRVNVVLSVGTPVGLDAVGSLVPAGIPDGHTFEFDSEDFRSNTFATRNPATGAAVTSAVTEAKAAQGLLGISGNLATQVEKFVRTVGVTSYNVFAHEGGVSFTGWPSYSLQHSNPVNYAQHNTMSQDLVAITCDYCLLVPYVQGKNLLGSAVKVFDNDAGGVAVLSKKAKSYVFAHDELIVSGVGAAMTSGLSLVYISPNCGIDDDGIAGAAPDGGFTPADGGTVAASFLAPGDTVGTVVDVTRVGLHILYSNDTAKYIVVRQTDHFALSAGVTVSDIDDQTGTGVATSGGFQLALEAPLQPGDYVIARAGKFVKYVQGRHDVDEIAGQILAVDKNVTDKSYLSRVKSAYDRAVSPGDMMPGSATRGVPFQLHMVTDGAWRQFTRKIDLDGTALATAGMGTPALRLVTINLLK